MNDLVATLDSVKHHFRECVHCFGRGTVKTGTERYGLKRCPNCEGNGYIRTTNYEPQWPNRRGAGVPET